MTESRRAVSELRALITTVAVWLTGIGWYLFGLSLAMLFFGLVLIAILPPPRSGHLTGLHDLAGLLFGVGAAGFVLGYLILRFRGRNPKGRDTVIDRPERESDDEEEEDAMIQNAVSRGGTIYSEAEQMKLTGRLIKRVRELTKTIVKHGQATNDLTERVRKLNVWLLVITIAIGVMTLVQALAAWKALTK